MPCFHQRDGVGSRWITRRVIGYRKVHFTDFQMALWYLQQPPPPAVQTQTLRSGPLKSKMRKNKTKKNTEQFVRGDRHRVSGGPTMTFSFPLTAEVVPSSPPVSQYITLSYSFFIKKKPLTSRTVCTRSKKKQRRETRFPPREYVQLENDCPSEKNPSAHIQHHTSP